jgi:hypothetical protein
MLTNRFTLLALPLSAASLFIAACGGGGGTATAGSSRAEMREAALNYAQCMRKHGVDMPDPQFNGGGMSMSIGGGPDTKRIPKATMDAAQRACQKIMEKIKPRSMSKEDQTKAREAALKMARCMRARGFDFPDPQFGAGGEIRQKMGFGRGVDPEDPRIQAAMTACAKASGGPGGAPMFKAGPG